MDLNNRQQFPQTADCELCAEAEKTYAAVQRRATRVIAGGAVVLFGSVFGLLVVPSALVAALCGTSFAALLYGRSLRHQTLVHYRHALGDSHTHLNLLEFEKNAKLRFQLTSMLRLDHVGGKGEVLEPRWMSSSYLILSCDNDAVTYRRTKERFDRRETVTSFLYTLSLADRSLSSDRRVP